MIVNAEPDPLLDQPCLGFSVLTWLPANVQWQALQHELARRIPFPLALTPVARMHVSLQLLFPVRAEQSDKEGAWRSLEPEARRELRACADLSAFTLVFDELRVLERAIILVAREHEAVRAVRERFVSLLARANLPTPRHDIIHTTLARYRLGGCFEPPPLSIAATHVRIDSVRLVRERKYGLAEYDTLAAASLGP